MADKSTRFTRRRAVLFGSVLTAAFAGVYSKESIKNLLKSEISAMHDEYAMLLNIDLRRTKLPLSPLVIANAVFRDNIDELVCENTQFHNCDFTGEVLINVKDFKEVKFVNCTVHRSSISGGRWNNVLFEGCNGIGEFGIGGGEGSKSVLFHKCIFTGTSPQKDSHREEGYGSAGSFGTASFVDCDISYMKLHGPAGLSIKDSRLNQVSATAQRKNGHLSLENVDVKDYLDLTAGIFSSVTFKNIRFEYIDMKNVKTDTLDMQECQGHFFGKSLAAKQFTIRKSTFGANGDPGDTSERENAGFSTLYAEIGLLLIDEVKFIGTNGSLFIGGAINIMFKKDRPEHGQPVDYTVYGKISIKNTSLKGAFLSYLKCDQIEIAHCDIENADFVNSQIENLHIFGSTFKGKADFTNAVINHFSAEDNIRKFDAKIVSDKNKLVTI